MPPPLCAVVHFVLLHHVQAERGQLAARLRDECVITFRTSLLLDLTTVEVQLIDAAATISGARKMAPTRVILMSCGSYNPPTNMHLRMFEIARDHLHRMGTHVVVGGVISPVHDAYAKTELASAKHRCTMLRLALQNNDWIRLSTWETRQNCWTKTRLSLQHHQNLLNSMLSNSNDIMHHTQTEDTEWIPENVKNSSDNTPIQIKLLCGADLLESFGICGLWLEEDIDAIVGEHGLVVITREGSNPNKFIYDSDILSKYMHNICIVTEWIPNEVSSTRIRRALKRGESVRYLLQDSVIDYIYKNGIYDAKVTDTTKLELSPNANKYLHIEPRYLSAFITPSPSDVTMGSPSPIEIISTASIDVPDAVLRKNLQNAVDGAEAREHFISAITADNGNIKHIIRLPAYPGQAKQVVVSSENGIARIIDEVGDSLDKFTVKFRQPGPSTSGESVLRKDDKSMIESVIQDKTNVEQREVLDLRSNAENTNIDLGSNDTCKVIVQIQSDQLSSNETTLREDCRLKTENIQNKEALEIISTTNFQTTSSLFQISEIGSQISHIVDEDLGSNEIIVKIQPGHLVSNELVPKEDHRSITESVPKDKTEFEQREVLALRTGTEIVDIDLDPENDREIVMKIQASYSNSNELRLKECCWPTREDTANDNVEIDGRALISQREIVDVGLGNNISELRIIDKICSDQTSFSKIAPENDPGLIESVAKGKTDFSNREISISKEMVDVGPDFINTGNFVEVQPSHIHNVITVKEDDRLKREKTKIEFDEGKTRSPLEDLELYEINKDNKELVELSLERIIRYNLESGNNEIDSKEETIVLESDKSPFKHLEAKTTLSPCSSITSLDGRHECALSDFSVDKEDYRLTQYCFNEEEAEEKSLCSVKSTKYADDQKGNMINGTIDSANDSEINFKKSDQVAVSTIIREDHEQKLEDTTIKRFNDRTIFSEESFQPKFNVEKSFSKAEEDVKSDDKNRERIEESLKILQEVDEANKMEKISQLDIDSSERRTSGDSNLEIDGKYLKSIVNSRKSPRKVRKDHICDTEIKELKNRQILQSKDFQTSSSQMDTFGKAKEVQTHDVNEVKDQVSNDRKIFPSGKVFQNSLRTNSMKVRSPREVEEFQSNSVRRRSTEEVFQDFPRTTSTKTKSPRRLKELQTENDYGFKNQTKSNDQEISQSRRASQKSLKMSSAETKSSKNIRQKSARYRSGGMKDYDRSINDRVISQLEEVFQNSSRKSIGNVEGPKTLFEDNIKAKDQNRPINNRETFEELPHHSSKMSSAKSPKKAQIQKDAKADEKKTVIDKTKQDFRDVYTRKVRRYNIPLQGSLDSMIVFDESNVQQPKKNDAFTKKSKSYESIKRIQEVFLGVPSKMSNGSSQLDIPDDFCSICCYMNEITFRTEEEVSSPNQETFYTLRSTCSSLADDDESIECDICNSLNLQESTDNLEGKVLMNSAHGDIHCELCRICGEVDDSFEQNSAPTDRYAFNVIEPSQDDDDSFEIENCGFQSGTESADDRSRISEREKIKESFRPKSQSLFIHGSSMVRDRPRELYFIPKDEIAILTSGMRRVGRKGSLFRKKEDLNGSARSNRRYSSVDSLPLTKMSAKIDDKVFKNTKNPMLIGSADNLQILRKGSRRSKSLQRLADNSSTDNLDLLVESLRKEEDTAQTSANWTQRTNIRDKEAVKMILTQHGIKIISEKETAL